MNRHIDTDREILKHAIHALEREAGLCLQIVARQADVDDYTIDAVVRFEVGDKTLLVEIKKWAQQANLGALIDQVQRLPGENGLLAADYIDPVMADKLRQQDVQFIDTVGNAYINQPPVYVYIKGNRKEARGLIPTKGGAHRAFEPKGLMVIYAFLQDPRLVEAPYREIAQRTGVAVGTVGWVLNGLKAANFIREKGGKKRRHLVHYRKLLDRWVEGWPEKLKPKQLIGEFVADNPHWWQDIDITAYNGHWGGEIAAAKYTDYLKPAIATVYLPDKMCTKLLRDARLRKATAWTDNKAGTVLIFRPFWPEQHDADVRKGLVHPVLTYADLVATADPRNLEVARRIYDEHIAQYSGQD